MQKCNLAVDIGASSGRVLAGFLKDGQLQLDEIHRFENKMENQNGHLCWNIDKLYEEVKLGIKQSVEKGFNPISIGVDTWAVDFVLLDEQKNRLTDAVAYRDHRTDGIMEEIFSFIDQKEIYKQTGIQFQPFNTIYQLYALKKEDPMIFDQAHYFLMIPDYLHFLLTGKLSNEYTNATTTQLLNAESEDWNSEFLENLGIPKHLFQPPMKPLQTLGPIREELKEELGVDLQVILPGTHDTASAVMSVPATETIYISSGTWSLMGVEHEKPISSEEAFSYNFTNEGGVHHNIRFLKNIMGLWMIQEVKREYQDKYSFQDFVDLAYKETQFDSTVDVNDARFLSPKSMIEAIQSYCKETNQLEPKTPGELAVCIFNSLVESYHAAAKQIEELTNKSYPSIHIIGGGSKNNFMNEKLAAKSGKEVYTGPTEATGIGNLIAQLIATNEVESVEQSKEIIRESFTISKF
ncbi:rhamnulokinase [Gracilibacillus sp. YIM 98692]|uniref:rhamnulokinase n=1 Tax=Gracilibacillus sp. YIM 98692 TaxID=2663532 RepID=UPI0013D362F0|nr:rhamnulokinase [Gracilibacillus sp. YIM 98692]